MEATTVSKKGREKERKKIAVCTLSFKFHFPDYHINGVTERPYQMNSKYAVARSKCPAHLLMQIGLDNNSRRKKKIPTVVLEIAKTFEMPKTFLCQEYTLCMTLYKVLLH